MAPHGKRSAAVRRYHDANVETPARWSADPLPVSRPLTTAQRRRLKERAVVLATGGLLLGPLAGLGLKLMRLTALTTGQLLFSVAATLAVQGVAWWIVRTGWDTRLRWDPHYLYVPMLLAAGLLNLYMYLAPEARYLILLAWIVALLFMVGLAGFLEVVTLTAVMTAGYLAILSRLLSEGAQVNVALEHFFVAAFFMVSLYAGVVFERLRNERRETARLRVRLTELAATDVLTGLPNRRQLELILETELADLRRYGGECALAMIDVDFFKPYNDTWGHLAGDAALRELAELLRGRMRASDVLARYGGEEFGLVMKRTARDEAVRTVERLRIAVETYAFHPAMGREAPLTISAGVAAAPEDAWEYATLVQRADEALYEAKRLGRNRVEAART